MLIFWQPDSSKITQTDLFCNSTDTVIANDWYLSHDVKLIAMSNNWFLVYLDHYPIHTFSYLINHK